MTDVLSSWSRRRAAVAAEAAAEEKAAEDAVHQSEQLARAEMSDEEILEELGLPDPDELVQGDDFKAFMAKAVPQHLRKRALRQLWRSNPVLACVDGLNDYDDDYLTAGLGQGAIKTGYQVGKGMLSHLLEVERLKQAALDTSDAPGAVEAAEEAEDIVPDAPEDSIADPVSVAYTHEDEAEAEPQSPTPRRMQFQFEDDTA